MVPSEESLLPRRARSPYVATPAAPVAPSPRLLASWRRSEDYGVDLQEVEPVWSGTTASAAGDSLFFECGAEVLTGLHRTLANEPISLMLTDADGLVLNRLSGDTSLLRALDRVHLAPGFAFSEREAGTNGLGMALADRTPSLVRAEEHYSASLCTYTCAAVPVLDPLSGQLEGSVNITTWARSSSDLLLALAQSAAGTTSALMLARSQGRRSRPQPRGGVFRVQNARLEPAAGTIREMSSAWTEALATATRAIEDGKVVVAVGEPGSGRATLLAQAFRRARPRDRILSAAVPSPEDVETWLSLWTPELGKEHTAVIVEGADSLPAWGAQALHDLAVAARTAMPDASAAQRVLPWAATADRLDEVPLVLRALVDSVVEVPPLRERPADVLPLARYAAHNTRAREIGFTPAAERALAGYGWPGNVDELFAVVHDAALRADTVDLRHLPGRVLGGATAPTVGRIEQFEREEIARLLAQPGMTMKDVAGELGMSRATLYRKVSHYGLTTTR